MFVHRHYELKDEVLYVFCIEYTINEENYVIVKRVAIHAVNKDDRDKYGLDARLSKCLNDNPTTITEGMYNDAIRMLTEDGVFNDNTN